MEKRLESLPLGNIRIRDRFWDRYTGLVTEKILPYQWDILNDRVEGAEPSRCIRNFEVAAGRKQGDFYGFVFQDTDLAKWIEAAAYSLSYKPNSSLEDTVDAAVDLIAASQCPDGYLNTYFTVKEPDGRFTNLGEGHELYTAGHMMEAAVAYYEVTGKDRFLNVMCKMADLLCDVFGSEEYKDAIPGHQEVEIGLYKLYKATGERKYLDLAKEFLDRRGRMPCYFEEERKKPGWTDVFHNPDPVIPEYSQSDEPVRKQTKAKGHAVRAVYMYSAMADIAYEYDDTELLDACRRLYDNIVSAQMYITGGIGQSGIYERFTTDFDLPSDRNYSETCASIGLALFCRRMLGITREERYAATMETALMNTVLAGVALDGESFFYVNPLEVWPDNLIPYTSMSHVKSTRQKWFGCACCPPNIARTLAGLGEYTVFTEEDSVWINMYMGCEFDTSFSGVPVHFTIRTQMPFEGKVAISIRAEGEACGSLMIRIPGYAENCKVIVTDGSAVTREISPETGKYLEIPVRLGQDGGYEMNVTNDFDMPAKFVYADGRVRADAGKVAVVKGPLVYAAEEIDNYGNLPSFVADTGAPVEEDYDPELFGGTKILTVTGFKEENDPALGLYRLVPPTPVPARLRLIPYPFWNNRGKGEMLVWMRYSDKGGFGR